jgi:hypothetical protein
MKRFKELKSSLFEGLCAATLPGTPSSPDTNTAAPAPPPHPPPDSLELSQTQYFTPSFLSEFHLRRGYDLTPYLPLVLVCAKPHPFAPVVEVLETTDDRAKRVRWDFALTVSDLFMDRRLDPLQRWANSVRAVARFFHFVVVWWAVAEQGRGLIDTPATRQIGMTLRNQPYGIDFDAALAATKVDIVEGEVRPVHNRSSRTRSLTLAPSSARPDVVLSWQRRLV